MRSVRILSIKSENMDGRRVGVGVCCFSGWLTRGPVLSFHVFLALLLAYSLEERRINALPEGPPTNIIVFNAVIFCWFSTRSKTSCKSTRARAHVFSAKRLPKAAAAARATVTRLGELGPFDGVVTTLSWSTRAQSITRYIRNPTCENGGTRWPVTLVADVKYEIVQSDSMLDSMHIAAWEGFFRSN